jgi:hypothetical protein
VPNDEDRLYVETRNSYGVLFRKSVENNPLAKPRTGWENGIRMAPDRT